MSLGIQNRIEASITYSLLKSKFPLKSSSQKKKKNSLVQLDFISRLLSRLCFIDDILPENIFCVSQRSILIF